MRENKGGPLRTQSFGFALRVVKLYQHLSREKQEYVMSKQLLRSGTAIGAMVRESEHAESRSDFVHKLSIALKEANETDYWIELLHESGFIDAKGYESLSADITQLLKLLVASVKKAKQSL